ncbi:DUF6801 domain-containing protein [Streptomyces griseus]|uniref:DUF6801 domain-containing protein n=1 Tax=Streptomyces griseus TaxID=1911 RepID=UPI000A78BF6D|nr:DUF6801 domain-containing protein [Streptomyces griseus]
MRGATVAAFVALAPLLPAAAVAVGTLKVETALPYVCALPSGPLPATVRITAAFPDRAATGEEIRPTDVTTTVELPAAAVADLTALKAATVGAESRLTVAAAQGERRTDTTWSGTAQSVAVPAEGPLTLTTSGDVPSLTTDAAGDLVLTAGALAVDLAPSAADGTATDPAALAVTCVPGPDAEGRTVLATVPVGAPAGSGDPSAPPTAPATSSPSSPASPSPSSPLPSAGSLPPSSPAGPAAPGAANGADTVPAPPPAAPQAEEEPTPGAETPGAAEPRPDAPRCVTENPTALSLSAYITGYSNVRKLNGSSLIPLSCLLIEQGLPEPPSTPVPPGEFQFFTPSTAQLSYRGRKQTPPFTSTFVAFGFQPVTATMVLEQAGPITIGTLFRAIFANGDNYLDNTVRAPLVLRVLDAEVNGTKLDVGPSCRTERPLFSPEPEPARYPGDHLVLLGRGWIPAGQNAQGYQLTSGGPLVGEVTIPAFKNCGAGGENLDRLLTASISGSGNYVKQVQGQTCTVLNQLPTDEPQCTEDLQPYVVPKPER